MLRLSLYCDGSCTLNTGGWAFILRDERTNHEIIRSGRIISTDSNRAELIAAIEGLEVIQTTSRIKVFSDSLYLITGINERLSLWKQHDFKDVRNFDLWKRIDALSAEHRIIGKFIRGHSGHYENELCDKMAKEACHKNTTRTEQIKLSQKLG